MKEIWQAFFYYMRKTSPTSTFFADLAGEYPHYVAIIRLIPIIFFHRNHYTADIKKIQALPAVFFQKIEINLTFNLIILLSFWEALYGKCRHTYNRDRKGKAKPYPDWTDWTSPEGRTKCQRPGPGRDLFIGLFPALAFLGGMGHV